MQEKKTLIASIAVTAAILLSVVFWGKDYDKNETTMEVLSFPNPEQVKQEVKDKVDEVKQVIEEKAEEIKKEVEQLQDTLPIVPAIPEIKESPAPTLEETPKESANDSL